MKAGIAVGLLFLSSACFVQADTKSHFIGPEPCALCHKDIAAEQQQTAMANTWQAPFTTWLPANFSASVIDGLPYEFKRESEGISASVEFPSGNKTNFPVTVLMGGRRHGIGFLFPVDKIDGILLARPAMIQARYAWSPEKKKLLLAPGCAAARPESFESALGLVLSPTFEARCLACHGQPNLEGNGAKGGVHCESCHGPGSAHLLAISHGNPLQGIVNPKHLSNEESIGVCARCHVGLTRFSDPAAEDLLVANQVRAIKSSECFVQSRQAFSCTTCHDPHKDATDDSRAVKACLGCHSSEAKTHAAICPVNATGGCMGCHMPSVDMGPLHLVDHLIRVHPEQKIQAARRDANLRTQIQPGSEYLRLITTNTAEAAAAAQDRLTRGEAFYRVARETSVDHFAEIGGYLGRKTLADLPPAEAKEAARLAYGERSLIIRSDGKWLLIERLPRDFRWDADQLEIQAEESAARGDAKSAIEKSQEALKIYPQFLRALRFAGLTFAQSGNPKKAETVLAIAARLYPDDAGTQVALAVVREMLDDKVGARAAYQRAIALEPDFTAAYEKLGMLAFSSGDSNGAIAVFRQGLQIDPLSAALYYDLGLALRSAGDIDGAKQASSLAVRLSPGLIHQSP